MNFNDIAKDLPSLLAALFTAILFIQSGFDKVFDWNGNLEWLTGHFSSTPLAKMVPMMLATVTLMEVATGLLAAAGIFYFLFTGSLLIVFISGVVGALSITALFFGQRIAKDYAGAAVLVPYFILQLIVIILSNPHLR
ncbi:hypothetical protein [Leptolyngbya sp. 7M]|uniref:hypothetical protein n=1 Tax=Leptolyngbya sp. 7M TaxID=2812896 RepID=UPI001B8B2DCA|nr:hypothetical protein [Leptolyngbya sp. 7M]QYO67432.1 hypothetical protein JVX88_11935 [Leptolyngbya sp. 7M]